MDFPFYSTVEDAKAAIKNCSEDFLLKLFRAYSRAEEAPYKDSILQVIKGQMQARKMLKMGKLQFPYYPAKTEEKKPRARKILKEMLEGKTEALYDITDTPDSELSEITDLLNKFELGYQINDAQAGQPLILKIFGLHWLNQAQEEELGIKLYACKAFKINAQVGVGEADSQVHAKKFLPVNRWARWVR